MLRTATARCRAPLINCQSLRGIAGTSTCTLRATILASVQPGSISQMRATAARTAMILAARSEPSAILNDFDLVRVDDCGIVDIDSRGCCNRNSEVAQTVSLRLPKRTTRKLTVCVTRKIMSVSELIYDWNKVAPQLHKP